MIDVSVTLTSEQVMLVRQACEEYLDALRDDLGDMTVHYPEHKDRVMATLGLTQVIDKMTRIERQISLVEDPS